MGPRKYRRYPEVHDFYLLDQTAAEFQSPDQGVDSELR